jgi:hypothetical protein
MESNGTNIGEGRRDWGSYKSKNNNEKNVKILALKWPYFKGRAIDLERKLFRLKK